MGTRLASLAALVSAVGVWTAPAGARQPPALPTLLGAAATYVAQFEARAAAFVFEALRADNQPSRSIGADGLHPA